jgi:type IV secretory pathway VirB4 component
MATSAKATQKFVPVQEIRDGTIILKDGSLRSIIMASSVNFALKSEDERTAILLQFQDFLNSLDFSVQIVIQSRRLDIRPYISLLEEQKRVQTSNLMKLQVEEYIEFIQNFTDHSNIMTKHFYVVIPYNPAILQTKNATGIGSLLGKKDKSLDAQKETFEEHRTQLEQRVSIVEQGLIRSGIRVARLETAEVIELFYKTLNPGEENKPIEIVSQQNQSVD